MNKNKGFILLLLLGIIALLVIRGSVYVYENKKGEPVITNNNIYQPSNEIPSNNISLDMTNEYAKTYKTIFTAEFAKSSNFDGHFRIVAIGCGSQCATLYALDKNNGKVYLVAGSNGDYEIVNNNQIRTTLNGQNVIYMFNPSKDKFEVQYVG